MWITIAQSELILEDENKHIYRWSTFAQLQDHIFKICNLHIDTIDALRFEYKWMNEEAEEEIYALFVSTDIHHHDKIFIWATNGVLQDSQTIDTKNDPDHHDVVIYSQEFLQQSIIIKDKESFSDCLSRAINPFLADTDFSLQQREGIKDEIVIWNTYTWKEISELIENYQSKYFLQTGTLCKNKFLKYLIETFT